MQGHTLYMSIGKKKTKKPHHESMSVVWPCIKIFPFHCANLLRATIILMDVTAEEILCAAGGQVSLLSWQRI